MLLERQVLSRLTKASGLQSIGHKSSLFRQLSRVGRYKKEYSTQLKVRESKLIDAKLGKEVTNGIFNFKLTSSSYPRLKLINQQFVSPTLLSTTSTLSPLSIRTLTLSSPTLCDINNDKEDNSKNDNNNNNNNNNNNRKNKTNLSEKTNEQILELLKSGKIPAHNLERLLELDYDRAVHLRREFLVATTNIGAEKFRPIPSQGFDYEGVFGKCCENVIGYVSLPVGVAGPLVVDDEPVLIPLATTEGCLVASTHRGIKAINASGGVSTVLLKDTMTRAPVLSVPSVAYGAKMISWLSTAENSTAIDEAFNGTSRFARLQSVDPTLAGRNLFLRFCATTGEAMGMNMVSKGVEASLSLLLEQFPEAKIVSISGNMCVDKKPSAINWIQGRGKSIVAETIVKADIVKNVLKTNVKDLIELDIRKNLVGSALAGTIGGNNAHASNLVSALFIAAGQDPAQNIESSHCMTLMEETDGGDLHMSVTMPSIEVGTIGGGTSLPAQAGVLDILGVNTKNSQDNYAIRSGSADPLSHRLAKITAGLVLAGELSLSAALAAGHLVQSHLKHNRK